MPCSVSAGKLPGHSMVLSAKELSAYIFSFKERVRNMYEDKTLVCKECGKEFVFTAG